MKPIRLPEPPASPHPMGGGGLPDIFQGDVYGVVRRAVVIGNGFTSSENQSIGLVHALGLSENQTLYRVARPRGGINEWLHWLPVSLHKKLYYIMSLMCDYSQLLIGRRGKRLIHLPKENGAGVGLSSVLEADVKSIVRMAKENFEKDGPLLLVASGRDTISTASSIKRLASDNVFVVQIQHPRSHLERFDMVITPQHDYFPLTSRGQEQIPRIFRKWITPYAPPDERVVLTVGSLHNVDAAALRSAANAWHDEFAPLPKPLLVVNIGGPTRYCRYGADLAKQLITSLHNVLTSCGSVRISFSRRTPEKVSKVIIKELGTHPKIYIWDGEEPNPHMGHLAWADSFVITADSVTMLSEACSTGKPVYVVGGERCKWKFVEFHQKLREKGQVRPFTGFEDMSESWSYPPLNDTAEAANRVRKALSERGWGLRA
ncbi:mitochondrial fission protein ELM1 [Andrographis paniculata]|uniref:mitochondrial fission protein ELM1 n=1 Tax=Andrographis paniculata TaxID=175694 RepID=UPI0021E7233F|nr:mitochondrial fission protein ELM1 [Andrographis paniculata]